jgi:hypothetical protein
VYFGDSPTFRRNMSHAAARLKRSLSLPPVFVTHASTLQMKVAVPPKSRASSEIECPLSKTTIFLSSVTDLNTILSDVNLFLKRLFSE